ncbi:MAG: bifunctional methylenetetrahydrofolate dehydrogenase/methenyltetrahydrofolate cyclohydrolase FolD [Chloroflexota bacterium]
MTARVIDGREVAASVFADVCARAYSLRARQIAPRLAFVSIGDSAPAQMYLHRLQRLGIKNGIEVDHIQLPQNVELDHLDRQVAALNEDDSVDGILVQMPLPPHLTYADLAIIIEPRKDVDGITIHNAGRMYLGLPGRRPSTALAMMEVLLHAGVEPLGMHAVVIGRSNVVGHPVAELLLDRDATVTVVHRQTRDLPEIVRQAELLLVGAGAPGLITGDMIRQGVVIVDAGINVMPEGLVGDVKFDECLRLASVITPVPGGVGPVTNAVLLRNVIDSAEQRAG